MPYRRPQAKSRPSNSLFEQSRMPPPDLQLVRLVAKGSFWTSRTTASV